MYVNLVNLVFMLSDLHTPGSVNFIKSCISRCLVVLNYVEAWGKLIIF